MNRIAIKVIKRKTKDETEQPQIITEVLKAENNERQKMGDTVNGWITEQRATSRREKAFSDGRILAWKLIP